MTSSRDDVSVAVLLVSILVVCNISQAQSATIVFHVSEELPSGTPVGNVKDSSNIAAEVGSAVADTLQFQILSADGLRITSIFSINSRTGAIFTNAMIDREQICERSSTCRLDFDVTVNSDVNFVKLLTVRVIVDDVNDNAPTFPKDEITLSVPESAPLNTEIPISGALDLDLGLNSTIRYSLQMSSIFGLKEVKQLDGSSSLKLHVQRALDRESVAQYSFLILASDGTGPQARTGTLTVNVVVTDVNDNVPAFSKDAFNMTVMETAPPGTVFGLLAASDGDTGANGQLKYRFSPLTQSQMTDLFAVNSSTGEVSVVSGGLQYESGRSFQCVVEVMDQGVPPQLSQAILTVLVQDAGNSPPKLDLTLADPVFGDLSAVLYENVKVGTFVGTLKVEDLDEGVDGRVSCTSLNPHFSLQNLDPEGGATSSNTNTNTNNNHRYGIVLGQSLDREETQEMRVSLVCTDSGSPALEASTAFNVIVRDVNDNAPVFSEDVYTAYVTENGSGVQSVTRVLATDRDDSTNSMVTYSLDSQGGQFFAVNPVTGTITTLNTFDREMTPVVTVTVTAVDSGDPALTGTCQVRVVIADVNDNAPYVNRSDYYVSEGSPLGVVVLTVDVADEDAGENGTVVLSLSGGGEGEGVGGVMMMNNSTSTPFNVHPNGSISLRRLLDREEQSVYRLPVTLRDRGTPRPLTSTATLTLHVVDRNDHAPAFTFPTPANNSAHVLAEVPVGSSVCQLQARDDDLGRNGRILFAISGGNDGQWLGINNATGDLFVIRALPGLAGTALHLRVSASDHGTPPLVATAFLDVFIQSANATGQGVTGVDKRQQDQYIVIAGVIAGVTFVVAVVVIAIIVHMRSSDVRRRAEVVRAKDLATRDQCSADNAKNLTALSNNQVIVTEGRSSKTTSTNNNNNINSNGSVHHHTFDDDGFMAGRERSLDNGGFDLDPQRAQSPKTRGGPVRADQGGFLSEEALEHLSQPSFSLYPESRHRLVSEENNSDISGETTTCDSGRGASDEEIVYPVTGSASGHADHRPPRIPPREPLALTLTSGQWSRDARVVSTNWALDATPTGVTTDDVALRLNNSPEDGFDVTQTTTSSSSLGVGGGGDFRSKALSPSSSSSRSGTGGGGSSSSGKGPLKVRFSFDGGRSGEPETHSNYHNDSAGYGSGDVTYHDENSTPRRGVTAAAPANINNKLGYEDSSSVVVSPHHHQYPHHQQPHKPHQQLPQHQQQHPHHHHQQQQQQPASNYYNNIHNQQHQLPSSSASRPKKNGGGSDVRSDVRHLSGRGPELRLTPESLYPRHDRFSPRKDGSSTGGWGGERERERERPAGGKSRSNNESLTSLPVSVDDDVSTTTSGSYSIDFDDVMNTSLEC